MKEFINRKILNQLGWKSAAQIITRWNERSNTTEHPTIAGQIVARLGLNNDVRFRFKPKPSLYSPIAISYIEDELARRLTKHKWYERKDGEGDSFVRPTC